MFTFQAGIGRRKIDNSGGKCHLLQHTLLYGTYHVQTVSIYACPWSTPFGMTAEMLSRCRAVAVLLNVLQYVL